MKSIAHPADGGTYEIDKRGKRVLIDPPTQDHPDGNRPRLPEDQPADIPAVIERAE